MDCEHIDLIGQVENLGGEVLFESLDEMVHGFTFFGPKRPVVVVNAGKDAPEQRETLAHELYHLNRGPIDGVDITYRIARGYTVAQSKEEMAADAFAAKLLMPIERVLSLYRAGLSIRAMAERLVVTERSLVLRLFELGVL